MIPILCLFFFGGAVLRDFSLAIIIGVVVGTYSSIFIASPIVLWWTRRAVAAQQPAAGNHPKNAAVTTRRLSTYCKSTGVDAAGSAEP